MRYALSMNRIVCCALSLLLALPVGAQDPAPAPAPAEPAPAAPAPAAPAPAPAPAPAAPAPAAPAAPDSAAAAGVSGNPDEPSIGERRLVAYVATGVAVVSLGVGITFGVLAQQEYACIQDVVACNKGLDNKIVGEELFDARAEVEQKALIADMAYLFAAASAVVATVGYLRGFVFVDEETTDAGAPAGAAQ
jgi:hypothetical protein